MVEAEIRTAGRRPNRLAAGLGLLAASLFFSAALAQQARSPDLADLSLEELANLEITSVSRRAERLADAPASVFVITGDDIRRSGVTSLPEALRLAPNLQVARVDARQYAISARGFNSTTANKLLVLIDGRTVYTPLFSGTFWDAQDVFLEDVDRIEVISGPGATLWGANAVNGVINVITRRAADTRGVLAFAGAGKHESGVGARYGTSLAAGDGAFRVYGKAFDRDNTIRANGDSAPDGWQNSQAGFRADWGSAASGFTLQGDAYRGTIDQAVSGDIRISGGNLLARWSRQFSAGDRLQVQAYLDHTDREIPGTFAQHLNTLDLEFQHSLQPRTGHLLIWGGGHRRSREHVGNSAALAFVPADRSLEWTNLFAQDEIELRSDLRVTLGAKVENNPYTGNDFLPSARVAWKPDKDRTVWGAASRAVRAPTRLDRELFVDAPTIRLDGGPDFRSEVSKVLELGYRAQPSARLSYSVSVFRSAHDHLRSLEPIGAGVFVIGNEMEGNTTGIEAWGSLQAHARWRLGAGAVLLDQDLRFKPGSGDTNVAAAGNDPAYQWMLRSSLDVTASQDFDVIVRHVGRLPSPVVPAYTAVDARYAWRPQRAVEFSVAGRGLFDRRHPEFGAPATRSEIERGLFFKVQWSL